MGIFAHSPANGYLSNRKGTLPYLVRESLALVLGSIILAAIIFQFPFHLVTSVCIIITLSAWISSKVGTE
jgi:hypothetical protein